MGLNYTEGCVNFRDVGGFHNLILGTNRFAEKRIYRGGSIDFFKSGSLINTSNYDKPKKG